jgi:predicted MPP superfamily phosphohydrolase
MRKNEAKMNLYCQKQTGLFGVMIDAAKCVGLMLMMCALINCSATESHLLVSKSTPQNLNQNSQGTQIAFLADVHLHDIYAAPMSGRDNTDLQKVNLENSFPKEPGTQAPLLMRSMQAQLTSTRLFNENFFVFRAALDDIAKRGIKLVALPGDFSDDGQPANVKALARTLDEYHTRYGMRFFAITGNHDPVRPFGRPGGKPNFLAADGKEVAIYSPDHTRCINNQAWFCMNDIREWGYHDIMQTLKSHGFSAHAKDVLYETPFSSAEFEQRGWQWCDQTSCIFMPDASYLVEPIKDVWLLAIDANVYIPKGKYAERNFKGSGNAGYNALLTHKPQLLQWIKSVVERAKAENKRLIAFSHFPMADFYDNTQPQLENLFGKTSNQLKRMPLPSTTEALNATGLKLHMAGHMHLYDIAVPENHTGLVNIQVPSLAAYQPGYSIVTLNPHHEAIVKTVIQKEVAQFDTLFPIYFKEWQQRQRHSQPLWNKSILASEDYLAFTEAHLKEVVRQRYVGKEWPNALATFIKSHTIGDVFNDAMCSVGSNTIPDEVASQPAMVLAYDYYKLRNAGAFANIAGREKWYISSINEEGFNACKTPNLNELQHLLEDFLSLLHNAALATDSTEIIVKGV